MMTRKKTKDYYLSSNLRKKLNIYKYCLVAEYIVKVYVAHIVYDQLMLAANDIYSLRGNAFCLCTV